MQWGTALGGIVIVAGSALPAWATPVAAASAPRQTPIEVHGCDEGMPDGWSVIEEASGVSDLFVQCNYLVERLVEEVNQVFVSGITITVEYFCTADEATQAFLGKTGKRDTETLRTDTKVVTEEGLAAANKDNPQGDDLIYGFGPVGYTLQEKAWELLSPQIVTTTYVLTNERDATTEDKRFGVAAAAPEVVTVVNNHLPTVCAVPPVGGATGPGGTTTATGGSGRGGRRILVTGGIAGAVAIGGVTVWRRRKPSAHPPSGITGVPPECMTHSQDYERHRETLLTLQDAFKDLHEELLMREKRQSANVLKANALLGLELGSYLGSAIDDVARSFKPRPPHVREPMDTWKPPGGLDARLSKGFQSAMDVLEKARLRVNGLRDQLKAAVAGIGDLANHPLVREAQERAAAALNSVRRAEQGLAASSAARQAIDTLEENIGKVSKAAAANYEKVEGLEKNIERFRGFISQAEDEITKMTATVDGANPLAKPAPSKDLLSRQSSLESMKRQLDRDLKELAPLKANHQDTMRNLESLMGRRDAAMRELAQAGDVLPRDVEKLREVHQRLMADAAATQGRVLGDINKQYEAARAALRQAEIEEGLAEAYLKGLHAQLQRAAAEAEPGVVRRAVSFGGQVLMSPVNLVLWTWEKGFGTTQSVGEIWEILSKGEEKIAELVRNVTLIERAMTTTKHQAERARADLQRCMDVSAARGGAPRAGEAA